MNVGEIVKITKGDLAGKDCKITYVRSHAGNVTYAGDIVDSGIHVSELVDSDFEQMSSYDEKTTSNSYSVPLSHKGLKLPAIEKLGHPLRSLF